MTLCILAILAFLINWLHYNYLFTSSILRACRILPHSTKDNTKSYRLLISPWTSVLRSTRVCKFSASSFSISRVAISFFHGVARYCFTQYSNSFRAPAMSSLENCHHIQLKGQWYMTAMCLSNQKCCVITGIS